MLKDYIKQIRGVSYKPTDILDKNSNNAVPIVRANNIQERGLNFDDLVYIDKSKVKDEQYLQAGDIVICASSGSKDLVGKAAYCLENKKASFGAFCKVVRTSALHKKYLSHFFQSDRYRREISESSKGANINNIRNEDIDNLQIIVPSIEEQQRIAEELDKVSGLIEKRQKQLEKLDLLIKSRFVEMFGDLEVKKKGYSVLKISDMIRFEGGNQPEKKYFEYKETKDNIRLIQIRDYKTDNYLTYIPKSMAKRLCDKNDIMIGRYGPPIFQILKGIEGAYNVALMKAIPKKGNREYIRHFLKQEKLLHFLEKLSKRTAGQDGVQMDKLNSYPIPNPPMELQNQFADFVEKVEQNKSKIKYSLDKLITLKKALMQKYFG